MEVNSLYPNCSNVALSLFIHTASMASSSSLLSAFESFFDRASSACHDATAAAVYRLLRRTEFAEDALLERLLVENDVTGATTVESALLLCENLPESRALRQEWLAYRNALEQRPEIQHFFRGHDHDAYYSRRCMSSI